MPVNVFSPQSVDKINNVALKRAKEAQAALKASIAAAGIKSGSSGDSESLAQSQRFRISKKDGLVTRIRFRFKRSGVFVHIGAGRGYGGLQGSTWKTKDGIFTRRTNPNSLGLAGTGARKAKPWFNPVIEQFADKIADDLADEMVEAVFTNLRLKGH